MNLKILGIPFPKQSFRFTKTGIKYQPAKVKKAEESIKMQIIQQLPKDFEPFDKGVIIERLLFVFPPLKGFSKKKMKELEEGKKIYKTTRPDLTDNLLKGLMDAMEGIVFVNDSQICEIKNIKKIYGLKPRTEIILREVEEK